MKKRAKLPTILGLLILVIGLVAGIFLINSKQIFKLGANPTYAPQDIKATNITTSTITITWTTTEKTQGFVKWGNNQTTLNKVSLEDNTDKAYTHSATLQGIETNKQIYFVINSEGEDYKNDGNPWTEKTVSSVQAAEESLSITGTILTSSGVPPESALVFVSVNGNLYSSPTSPNGTWIIPLSVYTSFDPTNTLLDITANAGVLGTTKASIYPQAAKSTPTMVIGKTYDFRTLDPNETADLPESELSAPDQIEKSSRFVIGETDVPEEVTVVTLESVDVEEIITTTDPEFFGSAPVGTEIEIIVESEMQTDTVTSTSGGKWSWSPPQNLEEGKHTITIKWRDASGILRTLTRTFYVQASELPAFESTPSATPSQSPTQSPTAVPTSSSTTSPLTTPTISSSPLATVVPTATSTVTAPPTPDSGSLTPTLGLFIMGIGILLSSIFMWNKSNAG